MNLVVKVMHRHYIYSSLGRAELTIIEVAISATL